MASLPGSKTPAPSLETNSGGGGEGRSEGWPSLHQAVQTKICPSASLVRGLRSRVSAAPAGEVSSPAALGPPPSPIISHGRDDLFQGLGWYIVA